MRKQTADHFLFTEAFYQVDLPSKRSSRMCGTICITARRSISKCTSASISPTRATWSIPAANDGKVVFADNLGIYGNCIVIDHGGGLQSIYGHMSAFSVKKGDMVKRGQEIGHSGQTGFAGGDHLHYSMQVDGVQVNPVEWWDAHWIKDRVWSKVK